MLAAAALLALAATPALGSFSANLAFRSPTIEERGIHNPEPSLFSRRAGGYEGKVSFPYGVASGDPLPNGIILWTHAEPAEETEQRVELEWQISTSEDSFDSPVASGVVSTSNAIDYSVKVDADGLEPWNTYYYRFVSQVDNTVASPVGRFRTTPAEGAQVDEELKFAVYSCSNLPWGFFHAFGNPARKDSVHYAVHLGDYIYEARGDGEGKSYGNGTALGRVPQPNKEIVTLEDYRLRYKSYRADADLQLAHAKNAWIIVWDDHEVADNSYISGTADSNNTEAGAIEGIFFNERKAHAVRAWWEWQPTRQVQSDDFGRIWREFHFGNLLDLIMIDTRNYERAITDVYYNTEEVKAMSQWANRTMIGDKQEAWLNETIAASSATWRVLGNQVIFASLNTSTDLNYDAWDGYQANRARVIEAITESHKENTIILTGDTHANWVSDIPAYNTAGDHTYDPATGEGSIAVELGGTAVSSPSSYGRNKNDTYYKSHAEQLVASNDVLQYAEGQLRGYFELRLTQQQAIAEYFGILNIEKADDPSELSLANFTIAAGENRLSRPVSGGKVNGGALQQAAEEKDGKKDGHRGKPRADEKEKEWN